MNEGAKDANESMHRQSLERSNEAVIEKLDKIIELLEKLVNTPEYTMSRD